MRVARVFLLETLTTLQPGAERVRLWVFPVWNGDRDLQRISNYFNFMIFLPGRELPPAVVEKAGLVRGS